MSAARAALVTVRIGGTEVPPEAVRSVRVEQSLHVPDQVTVRLADPRFERAGRGIGMGVALDVDVDVGDGPSPLARTEVTSVGMEVEGYDRAETAVIGLDRAHRLARGVKVRTFTSMDDAAIIRSIASEHGLQAKIDAQSSQHVYLLQHGSDFDLVCERAAALGCHWWVEDTTLNVGPAGGGGASRPLDLGVNLRAFRVSVSAAAGAADVLVQGWDPLNQQTVAERCALPEADPGKGIGTDAELPSDLVRQSRRAALKTSRFVGSSAVASAAEARSLAGALAHDLAAEQVMARGEALGDPFMRPGTEVAVGGVSPALDGSFLVTSATHVLGAGGYVTRFECGGRAGRTLVDLLGAPHARTSTTSSGSLVVGIVTNARDPQKHGRVKVKYPTLSSTDESAWARVASVGAGSGRGLHVVPDVGDEVLLGFEHGDLRRPIVLGGLWSGKQGHPVHEQEQTTGALWRTKAGHVLEMSDGPGAPHRFVNVALADGKTTLRIAEDGVEVRTPNGLTLVADKGGEITVKGQLKISADSITVSASQRLVLEGQRGVSINGGNGQVTVRGVTVDAGGTSKTNLGGAAGMTEVKGSVVKLN